MLDALTGHDDVGVIAEIKRRSPSRGEINASLAAPDQAAAYADAGARAISVLTEPEHFGGALADLEAVSRTVSIPLLRKDFTVDTFQLLEARAAGASAVLLIVRALEAPLLAALYRDARQLGLDCVVEVRSESELDEALQIGARVIGVNSRDLETLAIDHSVRARLLPRIPQDRIAIAESGIVDAAGVRAAAALGADAVLVGSALSAAAHPGESVRALTLVPRERRHD